MTELKILIRDIYYSEYRGWKLFHAVFQASKQANSLLIKRVVCLILKHKPSKGVYIKEFRHMQVVCLRCGKVINEY